VTFRRHLGDNAGGKSARHAVAVSRRGDKEEKEEEDEEEEKERERERERERAHVSAIGRGARTRRAEGGCDLFRRALISEAERAREAQKRRRGGRTVLREKETPRAIERE